MHRRRAPFAPADVQTAGVQLDLVPLQIAQLGSSKPMPVGQQDHGGVPMPVATVLASGFDELLDLAAGEIAPGAEMEIAPGADTEGFTVFGVSPPTGRMCMK